MKLPAFFISHGGPPILLTYDSPTYKFWQQLGKRLLDNYITPGHIKAILVVSAHWETEGIKVNTTETPKIIHDFYGYARALYEQTYDCKGNTQLALRIKNLLREASIECELDDLHGLDHGVWIPLKVMFPELPVPVVQLSISDSFDPTLHCELGKALVALREEGVLVIGSGASTHNFEEDYTGPMAQEFESLLVDTLTKFKGDERNKELIRIEALEVTKLAHPRTEHLMPAYFAAGAGGDDYGKKIHDDFCKPNSSLSAFEFI